MAIYHPPETIDEILEMDKLEYMENQNPLREDELKDPHRVIKIELLGIIATYQDPVCCNRIFRDFEEMNGYPLDPHAYGFKSFTSMMRTFSDKFTSYQDGLKTTYSAKPTERSGHLQELIRNQVTIEEKRRRDMRRSRSYGRNGRRSNYGAGIFYAQNFVPLLTDDRTLEQRTADNLASFGRSLAEHAGMGGLDWGGRRSRIDEEESDESDDAGGLILRSRSAPPRPPPMIDEKIEKIGVNVHDEPKNASEDCTNPFRTQNNVRIRDIVIQHGESDDMGRRGMGLVDVAVRFRKEYRLPLGGIPNLTEERIMQKMQAVETVEWIVEKMGDGHAYVIVPVETIKKAKEVGPGCRSDAPPADKPKSTGVSPAAKRMFGFALKSALNNNDRMEGTRERVIKERLQTEEMYDGEILCDSDGDPVMSTIPVQREKKIEKVEEKKEETTRSFDRETMMVLNDKVSLDPKVAGLASVYRILRTQPTTHPVGGRPSPSSSNSSLASNRGRTFAPLNGASSRFSPPNTSSSMSFGSSSFGGGPSTGAPSFGTFRSAPPTASLGAADKDDSDSDIIQPVQSSLASKLPQSTFASKPSSPATSGFVSSMVSSPASGQTVMFGTKNQAVPSSAPAATRPAVSFAPSPAAAPVSAFGGLKISQSPSFGGAAAPPQRKMVEVIEDESEKKSESKGGAELLGETIQLIGKLRSGIVVYLKQIEGTPVEDVVAGNPDFFDIDEKDERIHLLHTDVDPKLLMVDGRELGEMAGVAEEKKKVEEPPKEVKPITTAFSRPVPTFGGMVAPSFGGSRPTFGGVSRPVKVADDETDGRPTATLSATTSGNEQAKPRPGVPTFGGANRKVEEVKSVSSSFGAQPAVERAAPSAVSTEPAKPQPGMPSFGTKSLHVPERPDSALSTRSEKEPEKVRAAPTFTRPVEKKAEPVVAPPPPVVERPQSVMSDSTSTSDSTVESTQGSKYRTAESDFSGHKSESVCDSSGPSAQEEDEEVSDDEAGENGRGPFAFPRHRDIRRLTKKPSLLFDNVYKGSLHIASILTSMEPNRLVMTVHEGNMMMKVQLFMNELRSAYADQAPLSAENVKLGQFAVAINGEVIVRVVVLRYLEEANEFVCACLDINALIEVAAQNLYPLLEQFNVHAHRASTFIARICGLHALGERGHKAMELVVKPDEDPSFKLPCPFVLHGKDEVTGELLVDVAVVIANEAVWLGESLAPLIGQKGYKHDKFMNPGIDHAVMFAVKYGLAGYEISEKKEERKAVDLDEESESDTLNERDLCTLRSDSLENVQELVTSCGVQYKFSPTNRKKAEEKEEGELDSSRDDSTASERTTVERHAAGVADFGRDVKAEELQEDEFVVVAASPSKPVVDVESVTTLIRLFNDKGEHVSADVIKALCRALILSANNTLSSLGERGALIANAEALEAIDMA